MAGIGELWKPVLNVTDLDEGERFWSAVCGLVPAGRHGQFSVLDPPGTDADAPWMLLQEVPSGDSCGDGGTHVDVRVDDVAAAVAEIEALGGSVVRPPEFYWPDDRDLLEWAVMSDPFGNPFCLVRWPLEQCTRSAPSPDGADVLEGVAEIVERLDFDRAGG